VHFLRWCTDKVTFYRHPDDEAVGTGHPKKALSKLYEMNERKWLVRLIFLESVAGVPGMVAGMLRHLRSLRRMSRDNGWLVLLLIYSLWRIYFKSSLLKNYGQYRIETLLEEAYNERMHLLTFLKMAQPGLFMKLMVLGAQGVFFNVLFLSYLISPRTVHRFVGYLEEEAILTYTRVIADIEAGKLPHWDPLQTTNPKTAMAPDMAISYWKMPEGRRTVHDLMLYIRADEAKHREVNHTLANLEADDPNPFLSEYRVPDEGSVVGPLKEEHPTKGIERIRSKGWERDEVI
jgi:hypothetical protein